MDKPRYTTVSIFDTIQDLCEAIHTYVKSNSLPLLDDVEFELTVGNDIYKLRDGKLDDDMPAYYVVTSKDNRVIMKKKGPSAEKCNINSLHSKVYERFAELAENLKDDASVKKLAKAIDFFSSC